MFNLLPTFLSDKLLTLTVNNERKHVFKNITPTYFVVKVIQGALTESLPD